MIITKDETLKSIKEIGLDDAAMDLGLTLGSMTEQEADISWDNIIAAVREYINDSLSIEDFIIEIEHYASK